MADSGGACAPWVRVAELACPGISPALPRSFFLQPTLSVARDLLGMFVVRRFDDGARAVGRVVETEAYLTGDPACHAFRGETRRTRTMFGEAGRAYIHLNYGLHHCLNAVTGAEGCGEAVLIRAIEPIEGVDRMYANYFGAAGPPAGADERRLCAGPGRLTRALGIGPALEAADLTDSHGALYLAAGDPIADIVVVTAPRIGITKGADLPYRFYVGASGFVSRR